MARVLIGVDIGTQGTKAVLFDEDGQCQAQDFRPSDLKRPAPGAVEEDPERQFESVCQAIRACVRQARVGQGDIAGIGIDGQMAGIIGVGADGRHVTPYDSWLDARCSPYILQMNERAGDEILRKSGCAPSINHGPKKLWWMHGHPKTFRRIAAFVQPGGYVVMRLCGLDGSRAFIDATYLHFSGFANNPASEWDAGLCEIFGLPMEKLPRIVRPETVVGELTADGARACGVKPGVPVVAGCGDTAASFLACGATKEGICVDVAGTASVFAATTAEFRPDVKHRTLGCGQAATPGLWHPYAYINGGGMNLEWFRRELANRGGNSRQALHFDALNDRAAAAEPRDTSPMFIPHLGGRVSPSQPDLRGAWLGLTWEHTLGDLYRAVLEGVALEYGIYRQVLLELYPELSLRNARITGGGEKSAVWNQMKADVLQTCVLQLSRTEGAPMGAALLAGYGTGVFRSLPRAADAWVKTGGEVKPNRKMGAYYQRRLERYRKALDALGAI